jgi:hypothetical protein
MNARSTIRKRRSEAGIALLISIFVLLLISVVAIALIVASGTESSLAGNYRSATGVYYASLAGLEEARGRLLAKDPNSFKSTAAGFLPSPGIPLAIGQVRYVLNPGPTEALGNILTNYPDTEYDNEFGAGKLAAATVQTTASVWNRSPLNGLPVPGPLYKWVRINAVSELSLNLDVSPHDLTIDPKLVFYDGTNLNDTGLGSQVLEITSLAVLPNGSQKLLQYLAAPTQLNLSFPAALILDGNTPQFTASPSPSFWVRGNDQGSVGTCNPTPTAFIAVGYTDTGYTKSNFEQPSNPVGIPAGLWNNYTNAVALNPDIVPVTLSPNLLTVGGLNNLVQTIQQNADVVINGNATQADMPAGMSASNPMTIVVNGDLTFNGWHGTGYGLLLVTGNMASPGTPDFTYDPDASWNGIVLLIGKAWMNSHQGSFTTTQIQGVVFLAKTVDASNNPLASTSAPISSRFDFNSTPNTLSNGIYYSSCWIQASMPSLGYKILSFHEISQ